MSTNNSDVLKQRNIAIGVAVVALLLAIITFVMYNNQDNTLEKQAQELDETQQLKDELEQQYYEALSGLEEMKGSNEELNSLIEKQKEELAEKKDEISSLIRNKKDLRRARTEMANLKAQVEQYVVEIDNLKAENSALTGQNSRLSEEKAHLSSNLDAKSQENEELLTAKATLVSEKENLSNVNKTLAGKVDIASVIKTESVNVTGWKLRKNGKPAKKKHAKNIDQLEICFGASENKVTESGVELFYIRLINPLGETLAVEELGSGVLTSKETGKQIRYTQAKEINYNNSSANLCLNWEPNIPFQKGSYEVEIYNKGYLAGSGNFTLK